MSGKTLALVVGALVAAAVAFLVAQSRSPDTEVVGQAPLFPGLSAAINDVEQITVTGAGDAVKVTLMRGESAWTVKERGGYRADPAKVRKLLIELADAQLIERKTARAENYPVLGVEDVSAESARGVMITLAGADGDSAAILGSSARNNAATYVRRASEDVSWVANARLRVDQSPEDWLVKELIDVNASRVQSIRIEHADGEVVAATRGEANFEVADVPDGKTLSSPSVANAMAGVLDDLNFEDVTPADAFEAGDAPTTAITYRTSDGLKVEAEATAANGEYYLRLITAAERVDGSSFTSDAPPAENDPTPEQKSDAMLDAMQSQSADINARVEGWVFTIPLFKYEQLTRRMADLVGEEAPGPVE